MARDVARIREEFDRIALLSADHPSEDLYQDWLVRRVPRPCENALDIGCGTGSLSRALALRAARVQAIDLAPNMVAAARERSAHHPNIDFSVGDFLSLEFPSNHFNCIAAVGVLHHMPWARTVERAAGLLRVGGSLLIIDLLRADGLYDHLLGCVAWTLRLSGRLRARQPRELRDAWAEHGQGDSYLTLSEVRRLYRQALSGAKVRRHLFWRYSAVWTKVA